MTTVSGHPAGPAGRSRAERYDAWFASRWGCYAWAIETRAILAALGSLAGRKVADVGCGTGQLLAVLAAHGADAVGIDSDPAVLALAARRGPVLRADAHRLPLAGASLDPAVTVAALEFTASPGQVLAEMARHPPGRPAHRRRPQPGQPVGLLGRPAHRAPYNAGYFLPRADLLALGCRHGTASIRGVLFAAEHLPALGPVLETAGRMVPRYCAVQVLTVTTR